MNPLEDLIARVEAAAGQEMHPGDLLNIDMLKEAIEVEFIGTLWVKHDSGPMTPHVCEVVFGDGLDLLTIETINQRPNYHVVRVDSSWRGSHPYGSWYNTDTTGEHIDQVCFEIEMECGSGRPYDEDDDDYDPVADAEGYGARQPWPAFDDRDGCAWGHIRWDWLMKTIGYTAQIARLTTATAVATGPRSLEVGGL